MKIHIRISLWEKLRKKSQVKKHLPGITILSLQAALISFTVKLQMLTQCYTGKFSVELNVYLQIPG